MRKRNEVCNILLTSCSHALPNISLKLLQVKEAAALEAASQTKEEFSGNDTSRHPKVFKLGPKLGYQ